VDLLKALVDRTVAPAGLKAARRNKGDLTAISKRCASFFDPSYPLFAQFTDFSAAFTEGQGRIPCGR
jgi:hypothetical protein